MQIPTTTNKLLVIYAKPVEPENTLNNFLLSTKFSSTRYLYIHGCIHTLKRYTNDLRHKSATQQSLGSGLLLDLGRTEIKGAEGVVGLGDDDDVNYN